MAKSICRSPFLIHPSAMLTSITLVMEVMFYITIIVMVCELVTTNTFLNV